MLEFTPDLDDYFARINYSGPRQPVLSTLNGIIAGHVSHIPFENLDVLLGEPIQLDPAQIERKLVHGQRGGYCFEQNSLMLHVLSALGFSVTPHRARERIALPRDHTPPRTHLFLKVVLDGQPWLVDCGVGALTPACALKLVCDVEQATPHDMRRLIFEAGRAELCGHPLGARFFHQVQIDGHWQDVCEFTTEAMPAIDRELANWFTSAHPQSQFKSRLMVARAAEDGSRIAILNRQLSFRCRDGVKTARELRDPQELLAALEQYFGLSFPPDTRFSCPGLDWST